MKTKATYYEILYVTPNAPQDVIQAAFLKAVKKNHPDCNPNDPHANDKMKMLNAIVEVLSDPDKRKRYDASIGIQQSNTSGATSTTGQQRQTAYEPPKKTEEQKAREAAADRLAQELREKAEREEWARKQRTNEWDIDAIKAREWEANFRRRCAEEEAAAIDKRKEMIGLAVVVAAVIIIAGLVLWAINC